MTYRIEKDFAFSASHRLEHLPEDHQCHRLHGHNYIVRVALHAEELDDAGFVIDYGELSYIKKLIDRELDHRHLNDVLPLIGGPDKPTAEGMARWLHDVVAQGLPRAVREEVTIAVGISETPKTWAWWTP